MQLVDRTLDRIDAWQQRRRVPSFVVAVVKKYGDDRGGHLAALVTYYGFLSLFPLLLVLVTVLGFLLHDNPSLRHDLLDSALADLPIVGQQLRRNVHAMGGNGLGLVIGLLGLVWGSLGVAAGRAARDGAGVGRRADAPSRLRRAPGAVAPDPRGARGRGRRRYRSRRRWRRSSRARRSWPWCRPCCSWR